MAETAKGKKYIEIQAYRYVREDGTKVRVPRHDRSTPRYFDRQEAAPVANRTRGGNSAD